jgi:hypothetical protein
MRLISPLQSSELDQVVVITAIFCMIAAYVAVLYTFWRRKTVRWIILVFMLVSIFIAPSFALAAVLGAIFSKIDQSKPLNSNKKLELMMWSVTGGVLVICLTLADLRVIPVLVAIAITIASLAVNGLVGCFIMWCLLGPPRYLEFIQQAKAEQNEVLAAQALRREIKQNKTRNTKATEDSVREAKKLLGPMPESGWQYLDHTIYIQTHARLEFAHPYMRELLSPFLPPDWDCFVDGKMVGLNFATAFYAKRNGVAFVLKQVAAREGRIVRLAEEEQATRPMLHSYQDQGRSVELFATKKSGLFEPEGWTCMVDGQLVGFGFRSLGKAKSNAYLYTRNRLGPRSRAEWPWEEPDC